MVKVWHAKEAVVKLDLAGNVAVTTAAALDTFFGSTATSVQGSMKDITITEPMSDMEKLDFLGSDGLVMGSFQNAEIEEKPATLAEVSGTLILPGDEVTESLIYSAATSISTTHDRYRAGLATIRKLALLLNLDDGTDAVNFVFDNMIATQKDTKVTGSDGHFEISFTGKCLPSDFFIEFKR